MMSIICPVYLSLYCHNLLEVKVIGACHHLHAAILRLILCHQKSCCSQECLASPNSCDTGGMKCLVEHIRLLKARGTFFHNTIGSKKQNSPVRAVLSDVSGCQGGCNFRSYEE